MGTLIQKIQFHPQVETMTPPRAGPMMSANPPTPLQMPSARPLVAAGNALVRMAIDIGVITEAPIPCTTRAAMSTSSVGDRAATTEPTTNTMNPTTYMRR